MCSPWDKDLCRALQLLQEDVGTLSRAQALLKTQLSSTGKMLVEYLEKGKVEVEEEYGERMGKSCVYYKAKGVIVMVVRK